MAASGRAEVSRDTVSPRPGRIRGRDRPGRSTAQSRGGTVSVSTSALATYLASADPAAAPLVRSLDENIRTAAPELDVAIKYGILMYGLRGDWRTWICAVQVTKKGVSLKFLYGVLLDDPLGVLRSGSSV